jgi:hypothetical protein
LFEPTLIYFDYSLKCSVCGYSREFVPKL